ncbi:MAG: DUF4832 domain-containing protein, partial [Kiritimatiellae bacterium]|nr:DUF4832 domain-containing protein [Kiritimatiellia bacterium]
DGADGAPGGLAAFGWSADGWRRLSGALPAPEEWTEWRIENDFTGDEAPRVRYSVGGTALRDAASGSEWLPLGAGAVRVSAVGFGGDGAFGSFSGTQVPAPDAGLEPAEGLVFSDSRDVLGGNPARTHFAEAMGKWIKLPADGNMQGLFVRYGLSGYTTPMFKLSDFSAGNDYGAKGRRVTTSTDPDTGETTVATNLLVGGADVPVSAEALDALRALLASGRANGACATVRFAYDWDGFTGCEPASFDTVLEHVRQLAAVLNEYSDVVLSVESGMIGPQGEGHSSKYDTRACSRALSLAWLEALDKRIAVQVRDTADLAWLCRETGNVPAETILAEADVFDPDGRVGLFNDAYLGNFEDWGTFMWNDSNGLSRENGMAYLKSRRRVPYGGEFATETEAYAHEGSSPVVLPVSSDDPDRKTWNVVKEWYDSHLSYVRDTHAATMTLARLLDERTFSEEEFGFDGMPGLSAWDGESLLSFMQNHLGYRFVLRSSKLSPQVAPGGTLGLFATVENTGFGDLFLSNVAEVVLSPAPVAEGGPGPGAGSFWTCPVSTDFGASVPSQQTSTVRLSVDLPASMPAGRWLAWLRVRCPMYGDDPPTYPVRRAVRFANPEEQWNADLSCNLLGAFEVAGDPVSDNGTLHETGTAADRGWDAPAFFLSALDAGSGAAQVALSAWAGRTVRVVAPA